MIEFFKTIIYEPIYNILLFVTSYVPGADVGIAIIIVTILIKLLLYPLSRKAIVSQARLKKIEPELNEIKENLKGDKQAQAQATLELYKKHGINPLSGCLPTLLQLPIILSLFYVFRDFSVDNLDFIYSFVTIPENISLTLFWVLDLTSRSIIIALLAGVSQYFVFRYSAASKQTPVNTNDGSIQGMMQKGLQTQTKYVFPVLIAIFAYQLYPPIGIYWITNNLFTIFQELRIQKQIKKEANS